MGLFGRRTEERETPTAVGSASVVDRDHDGVDDRDERRPADDKHLVDRSGDTAVYDARPVDAAPVDAAPVDAAPVDAAPVDADRKVGTDVKEDARAREAHERTESRLAARARLAAR